MSFAQPIYLYILPFAVVGMAFFLWFTEKQRQHALARLGNPVLIARLAAAVNQGGRLWVRILWTVSVALLLVAMARPQWGEEERTVEREGLQIVVALDVSASMLADDIKPNRLERAKLEIVDLMARLDGDEIALVPFAGASFVQFPLTTDYSTARRFLDGVDTNIISRPGTNVSDALQTARNAFDESASSQKVVLVITDGEAHDTDVLATAQSLADEGIALYTIGFGSPDGAPVPQLDAWGNAIGYKTDASGQQVLSRLDETTLQQIAEIGGGEYWLATPRAEELDALVSALAALQQGSFGSRTEVQRVERYQWFLGASFLLLVASLFVPERRAFVRRSRRVQPQEMPVQKIATQQKSTESQGVA